VTSLTTSAWEARSLPHLARKNEKLLARREHLLVQDKQTTLFLSPVNAPNSPQQSFFVHNTPLSDKSLVYTSGRKIKRA